MKVCVVKNCNSTGDGTKGGRSIFQFPVDTDKSNSSTVNTRCKHPTRRSFVCDLHFKKLIRYPNTNHSRRLLKSARVSEPIHSFISKILRNLFKDFFKSSNLRLFVKFPRGKIIKFIEKNFEKITSNINEKKINSEKKNKVKRLFSMWFKKIVSEVLFK